MDKKDTPAGDSPTAEQLNQAKASAKAEGVKEGESTGRKAERERVKAIVTHAEAKDRADMAQHLAFETDMEAEQATALLAKSPKAVPAKAGALAAAMDGRTPGVTHDAGGDEKGTTAAAKTRPAADIYSDRAKAVQAFGRPN